MILSFCSLHFLLDIFGNSSYGSIAGCFRSGPKKSICTPNLQTSPTLQPKRFRPRCHPPWVQLGPSMNCGRWISPTSA